jgi:hypothetical protein
MAIDLVPSAPVAITIAVCWASPILLFALSHGPWRIAAPGRRFVMAAILTWTAWLAAMAAVAPGWVDLVTGGLLLATATLAGFTLWTLIAWGFTLSMLLVLERAGSSITIEEWIRAYTRGRPLDALARDRVGLLLRLGLVSMSDKGLLVSAPRGGQFARVAFACRRVFGLSP